MSASNFPAAQSTANGNVDVKGKGRAVDQDATSDASDDGGASLYELEEADGFLRRASTSSQGTNDGYPARPGGHRARSSSIASLGLAFSGLQIPLSRESVDPLEATREVKHLDLLGGISLVIGLMVGSGIFSSPVSFQTVYSSIAANAFPRESSRPTAEV